MALNYIWIGFFLIAFVVALIRLIFFGDTEIFQHLVAGMFDSSKASVMDIALPLVGNMALWLGIMNIGEKAGAINYLSRIVGPFFSRLFPEIPKNHPATGNILMSFSANLLGLDNAATPLGLKAIGSLQELNPDKETASNAQIMYLVLLTSGLQLLPVTIIAQRAILHATDPTDIFIPCIIATFVAAITGMLVVSVKQKIRLFDRVIITWLGGITIFIGLLVWYFTVFLTKEQIGLKVNVFEVFIEGAKRGFETSVKIIPYLVAMLVGISVFRACDAMPVAYMKPLSGSGSKAMMINVMTTYGPNSFAGRLGCVFNGSADTTFYIVALYFGSVGIKRSRYAIPAGLIADLAGIIAAIFISYLFFG
eukprot:gene848-852_t